jgi:hypothetical protein
MTLSIVGSWVRAPPVHLLTSKNLLISRYLAMHGQTCGRRCESVREREGSLHVRVYAGQESGHLPRPVPEQDDQGRRRRPRRAEAG